MNTFVALLAIKLKTALFERSVAVADIEVRRERVEVSATMQSVDEFTLRAFSGELLQSFSGEDLRAFQ